MLVELLGHEVLLGDMGLLVFGVAREVDDFHAIAERRRNGVEKVGGTYAQLGMARTFDQALRELVNQMLARHPAGSELRVQVLHSYNEKAVLALRDMIAPLFKCHFMPVNYKVEPAPDEVDRTWVQLVLPYLQEFDVFRCPADFRHRERVEATFDVDFMPGDTYGRYYRASKLSNIGYNYLYLSPVIRVSGLWEVHPRTFSWIIDPASMLLFADTISPRTRDDEPLGGGSYIVIPPCRTGFAGEDTFELARAVVYAPRKGWLLQNNSPERYGRAWPWHLGRTNIARADGSLKSVTMDQLARGCDVRDNWDGRVSDPSNYLWDTQ